ncbi:hypothetical protein MHM84_16680 [Halomonas sp. McH1-25]|uniref:I78 family peptidase inhibitor n=2 Tax=Halomonas TaxID=2745 RepID=UPI001EF43A57|nr:MULTISPECIES: I78 family peptidase inhibitor [unclassified Halomonas]MCG7601408.1 hypothetical protein [Halomonas sp. McH1-25]MCP1341949.1 I78 family peptidase inhibitor [Halomonas sp. FL8]
MKRIALSGACAMLLAGCAPSPSPDPAPPPPPMQESGGECDATAIQDYRGEEYRAALEQILANQSGAQRVRVIRPGESYTMDYRPERLNIHLDEQGTISELSCG